MNKLFDLIILGAGSAGYAAARTAGALGARVALVDKGPLGGLCILRGCMPSKAILASADVLHQAQNATAMGLEISRAVANLPAIIARKRNLVKEFADYRIEQIHRAQGAELLEGVASFLDSHRIQVQGPRGTLIVEGKAFLIATGSSITIPDVPGLAQTGYLTSDQALELEHAPESLLILGGGVIACELGQFFARIGVKVTLVQRGAHVLSSEDADVGMALQEALEREGIKIFDHALPHAISRQGDRKIVQVRIGGRERQLEATELMVCTGRHPALEGLSLDKTGVEHTLRQIPVDAFMRTNIPHIFAAGDAMGRYQIVHQAIREAEIAAHNAVSEAPPLVIDDRLVPHVVFTDPQVARVGLTERQAAELGRDVVVGKYAFADHGKAMCLGRTEGFVKMVADAATGEIVGAAIVGPEGGELLHEIVVAMKFHCTAAQFLEIPHVHPTLAEILTYPAEEIEDQRRSASIRSTESRAPR